LVVQETLRPVLKISLIVLVCVGLLTPYIYFENNFPYIARVNLTSGKIPPGSALTILQITDFHNWRPDDRHEKLLDQIRALRPDVIVITGDLVDRKTADFTNAWYFAKELVKINPHTYFVYGNHEWANKRLKIFAIGLKDCGVIILNNEHAVYSLGQLTVNICGVNDPVTWRANPDKATAGINPDLFTVLLAHAPSVIKRPAVGRADLVLCGHTHGGQIRLPLIGAVWASNQGLFPAYDKGVYQIAPHTTLYVDSGLGTGVLPIRFLDRSQISLLTVTHKQ